MNNEKFNQLSLLTLALFSIFFGMVLFELALFAVQLPAWGLLPAFFAMALLYKLVEELGKQRMLTTLPRLVTVEYSWYPFSQEAL